MKKIIKWIWQKSINFCKWVWRECRNWQTLLLLLFVCIFVGAPVWVCGLLGLIFNWAWAWAVFAALLAFWWLPGTPYFAVCVAITLGIKRFFQKYKRKHPEAFENGTYVTHKKRKVLEEAKLEEKSDEGNDNQ